MKKRLIFLTMALVLCLGLSISAQAAEETSGSFGKDVVWSFDTATGKLVISGTSVMDGWNFARDNPWEHLKDRITEVVIEEGITSVGYNAFEGCGDLTAVTIPDSVKVINEYAFARCTNLQAVTIPNGVETIGKYAFARCVNLQTIDIPSSVTSIEVSAFIGCSSLVSTLPSAENTVYAAYGDGALYSKDLQVFLRVPDGLTGTFTVPHGVQEIGNNAFCNNQNLSAVILPESITKIGTGAFTGSEISSVNIPKNVTEIGHSAFMYCDQLKRICIPASVTHIEDSAFYSSSINQKREICFFGNAPAFGKTCFNNSTFTAYYPANDPSWSDDVMLDYGGKVTWIPWGPNTGEVLTTWTAKDGETSVSIFDPEGSLKHEAVAVVFAAVYGGERAIEIVPGVLSGEAAAFNKELGVGSKIFFLRPESLRPVCRAAVLI